MVCSFRFRHGWRGGLLLLSALALVLVCTCGASMAAEDARSTKEQRQALLMLQDAFTSIARAVEPAVVGVTASDRSPSADAGGGQSQDQGAQPDQQPAQPAPPVESTGSGVIVRLQGIDYYVLTNYHVIANAARIRVSVNGIKEPIRAAMVGKGDPKTDLALLRIRIPGPQPPERVAKLGDSSTVQVGQWAIAIGNPLNIGQTLTVGVVSATGREIRVGGSVADYRDLIQTDASINPGNSGGPLVNINGEVIGINSAIASRSGGSIGIGFAIPINTAKTVVDQLIRNGEVIRGWLGVKTFTYNREIDPALGRLLGVTAGAFADDIYPGSPAAKAGIRPEDVIVGWGDQRVESFSDLENLVAATPPGQQVRVRLVRNRQPMDVTVLIEKRPPEGEILSETPPQGQRPPQPKTETAVGLTVRELNPDEARQLGVDGGVVILNVERGSGAAEEGLLRGDVIVRVNQTPVKTLADFRQATAGIGASDPYVLRMKRQMPDGTRADTTVVVRPAD